LDPSGPKDLREWIAASDGNLASLAKRLDVTTQAVWNWVNGVSRPSPANRDAIEHITGIHRREWLTPEELAHLNKVCGPQQN